MLSVEHGEAVHLEVVHQLFGLMQVVFFTHRDDFVRGGAADGHLVERSTLRVGSHADVAIREDADDVAFGVYHLDAPAIVVPHDLRGPVHGVRCATSSDAPGHDVSDFHGGPPFATLKSKLRATEDDGDGPNAARWPA